MDNAGGQGWLYNMATGEARFEGTWGLSPLDGQWARVSTWSSNGDTVIDAEGRESTALRGFLNDAAGPDGYDITGWQGYFIVTAYNHNGDNRTTVLDAGFTPIYSCTGNLHPLGDYLWHTDGSDIQRAVEMPSGRVVFETDGGYLQYFDGTNAVVGLGGEYRLHAADGRLLAGPFPVLQAGASGGQPLFLAYAPALQALMTLDPRGQVVAQTPWPGADWFPDYTIEDCFVVPVPYDHPDGWQDNHYALLGSDLSLRIPGGRYTDLTRWEDMAPGTLVGSWTLDEATWETRYDILDTGGNTLIGGLTAVDWQDGERLVVQKGFSAGLMDYAGNWLYRQSAFAALEDE